MKPKLLLDSKKRTQLLIRMNPAMRAKAEEAIGLFETAARRDVMSRYDIGAIAKEVSDNPDKYAAVTTESGTVVEINTIKELARVMAVPHHYVLDCLRLCSVYTRQRMGELMEQARHAGGAFTVSHFLRIAYVTGPGSSKVRPKLEDLVSTGAVSVQELDLVIQNFMGGNRRRGPAVREPRSPSHGIKQILDVSRKYEKQLSGWENVVYRGLLEAGPDAFTPELASQIEQAIEAETELIAQASQMIRWLEEVKDRAVAVVGNGQLALPAPAEPVMEELPGDRPPGPRRGRPRKVKPTNGAVIKKKASPKKGGAGRPKKATRRKRRVVKA